jgi:hypothetical protein
VGRSVGVLIMTENLSGAGGKKGKLSEELMADEGEILDFEVDEEIVPPKTPTVVNSKDPSVRRKIEDRLERIRLREELGIYDERSWEDL